MGWQFDLKHANTVAYLTVPAHQKPPRLTAWQLREFLGSIQGEYRDKPPLISSDSIWVERLVESAREASRWLEAQGLNDETIVERDIASRLLFDLRQEFGHYDLYGLAVGTWDHSEPLQAFSEHAAYSSGHHGLFLIPDFPSNDSTLEIFDPSPVTKRFTSNPDRWPGMLFWLKSGEAAFASLQDAEQLFHELMSAIRQQPDNYNILSKIIKKFNEYADESKTKRILQLSDLHFGDYAALQNQAYLSAHLRTKMDSYERVVVTGDLFNNPKKNDALAFRNFRSDLEATTGKELIVVPGNHDQKIKGNTFLGFGRKLKELAKLEWSNLVVDDELQCVFYCFDTSREANDYARGRITKDQMIEVATLFETKLISKPELREYLSVALIHHHPYSFETRTETPLQKGLHRVGLSDEHFLKMDGAEDFLSWCVGRRVPLILHGHKHVPRHVNDRITWTHGKEHESREVTAVGCGTSMGAEGMPLSYNELEWSPTARKWSATFYSDPGHGTGFEEIYVALHTNTRS